MIHLFLVRMLFEYIFRQISHEVVLSFGVTGSWFFPILSHTVEQRLSFLGVINLIPPQNERRQSLTVS